MIQKNIAWIGTGGLVEIWPQKQTEIKLEQFVKMALKIQLEVEQ